MNASLHLIKNNIRVITLPLMEFTFGWHVRTWGNGEREVISWNTTFQMTTQMIGKSKRKNEANIIFLKNQISKLD